MLGVEPRSSGRDARPFNHKNHLIRIIMEVNLWMCLSGVIYSRLTDAGRCTLNVGIPTNGLGPRVNRKERES